MLEEIAGLYQAYLDEFHRLEQGRRPLDGAFGFGGGRRSYPCHETFIRDMERLLEKLTAREPTSEQAGQVLEYIYCTAPARWESEPSVYWSMLAVQGLTMGLIDRLDASDAKTLYGAYKRFYPRFKRLPVQNKILAALRMNCNKKGEQ